MPVRHSVGSAPASCRRRTSLFSVSPRSTQYAPFEAMPEDKSIPTEKRFENSGSECDARKMFWNLRCSPGLAPDVDEPAGEERRRSGQSGTSLQRIGASMKNLNVSKIESKIESKMSTFPWSMLVSKKIKLSSRHFEEIAAFCSAFLEHMRFLAQGSSLSCAACAIYVGYLGH